MKTNERRQEIMKLLCRRQHETMCNLAAEFDVSIRTIQRDIEALSLTEPIYTQTGKYNGGVYVMEGYSLDHMYMSDPQIALLKRIYIFISNDTKFLTCEELKAFSSLISQYSKPKPFS